MEFESICLNIAKARLQKGISAYELSLRIGKDASYINKLENGKINLSIKSLLAICEELHIPPYILFEEKGENLIDNCGNG